MLHTYSNWYVFEDKMSFNKVFLQWFCEQQNISEQIRESIKTRNGLGGDKEIVKNPLFDKDDFLPIEDTFPNLILTKQNINEQTPEKQVNKLCLQNKDELSYANLSQHKISEKSVYFINNCTAQCFTQMISKLKECNYIGFDAEYRCISTKYEQAGVSIIQLSTGTQIFLLDFISLQKQQVFVTFFKELLSNPEIFIVGHSISSDIKYIERTMKIETVQGVIDIAKIFKQKFPNQKQSSLSFMTTFLTGKLLSKYEQRSNWNRRPLKRSQSHYAALDAQICLVLYNKMKQKGIKFPENGQKMQTPKKKIGNFLIRTQNLVYLESQKEMLFNPKPLFLVDTMLKRLCSHLRNLGIDSQYMAKSDFSLMQEIAQKQKRIILTKDKKLLAKRYHRMPLYCITERGDSDLMLEQVKNQFKIDYSLFTPLSRCVKCNNHCLQVISKEQALKYVNFQNTETNIQKFWRCSKCKQVYWQGNQWKNAKKKFQNMQ